jgi:hypothetical protein
VNGNENLPDNSLQERVSQLTNRLESDVLLLRTQHDENLQFISADCNRLVEDLCALFNHGLKDVQDQYRETLVEMQRELSYLKELSDSQRVMMKSKVDYINELEERWSKIKPEGSV